MFFQLFYNAEAWFDDVTHSFKYTAKSTYQFLYCYLKVLSILINFELVDNLDIKLWKIYYIHILNQKTRNGKETKEFFFSLNIIL